MFWTLALFHKLTGDYPHTFSSVPSLSAARDLKLGNLAMEIHLMRELSLIWKFNRKGKKNCLWGNAFSIQKQEANYKKTPK